MHSDPGDSDQYSLAFTASSLRPELARIVADTYLGCGDWQETRQRVLADNLLQAGKRGSSIRMEQEMRQRLQTLTREQLEILAGASGDNRRAVAWLSVLKLYPFVCSFASGILRGKIEAHDPVLRPSDYEEFLASEALIHPEVQDLKPSTKAKIRQVLIRMLREAGILGEGRDDFSLQRALLPPDVLSAVAVEDRRWLAGFLVPDGEIATLGNGRDA
jgi:hypothetical protein